MLGGLDPVIIFQFSKLATSVGTTLSKIPIISDIPTVVDQPPIPIYLSERLFNIVIDNESKSVDIETDMETTTSGESPSVNQKGIQSSVEISIEGKSDSVALTLLSALIDLAFDKSTSKEYSITYMHGAITVFRGLLHSYSAETVPGTDKLAIKINISRGEKTPVKKETTGAVENSGIGSIPVGT